MVPASFNRHSLDLSRDRTSVVIFSWGCLQHIFSPLVASLTAHPVISIVGSYALQLFIRTLHTSLTAFPVRRLPRLHFVCSQRGIA